MIDGFPIDPKAIYDDSALCVGFGVSAESLARARQAGDLRHTRKGRRVLHLGQWVLDWFELDAKGVTHDRHPQKRS